MFIKISDGKVGLGRPARVFKQQWIVVQSEDMDRSFCLVQLEIMQVYCLPDMYEVVDRSLADIQYVLNPTYTGSQVFHFRMLMSIAIAAALCVQSDVEKPYNLDA